MIKNKLPDVKNTLLAYCYNFPFIISTRRNFSRQLTSQLKRRITEIFDIHFQMIKCIWCQLQIFPYFEWTKFKVSIRLTNEYDNNNMLLI